MNRQAVPFGERLFLWLNSMFLIALSFVALSPILTVLSTSFSSAFAADRGKVFLFPVEFSLDAWKFILRDASLWRSLFNTIGVTVVGTLFSLTMTALFAYPLAKKEFRIRNILMVMVVFTMIFRWPIIPYFLSIRSYGLMDTLWALILPHGIVAYNLVIMRTFFQQLPEELEESAYMEGANPLQILWKIVLPLSKPVLATLGLFYAVTYWNLFMHPMLFIRSADLYTLQIRLRALINSSRDLAEQGQRILVDVDLSPVTIEAATIIFGTVPILLVYPFLQKYFVKGALLGSLKG